MTCRVPCLPPELSEPVPERLAKSKGGTEHGRGASPFLDGLACDSGRDNRPGVEPGNTRSALKLGELDTSNRARGARAEVDGVEPWLETGLEPGLAFGLSACHCGWASITMGLKAIPGALPRPMLRRSTWSEMSPLWLAGAVPVAPATAPPAFGPRSGSRQAAANAGVAIRTELSSEGPSEEGGDVSTSYVPPLRRRALQCSLRASCGPCSAEDELPCGVGREAGHTTTDSGELARNRLSESSRSWRSFSVSMRSSRFSCSTSRYDLVSRPASDGGAKSGQLGTGRKLLMPTPAKSSLARDAFEASDSEPVCCNMKSKAVFTFRRTGPYCSSCRITSSKTSLYTRK